MAKKKFKNIDEMLVFLAGLRKRTDAALKREQAELKKYDKLLKKEEAIVAEIEAKYKTKSKSRNGAKLR